MQLNINKYLTVVIVNYKWVINYLLDHKHKSDRGQIVFKFWLIAKALYTHLVTFKQMLTQVNDL